MDICCGQKMLSVLDFDNYRPSSRCGLCFGSGKFYLGSAVNQLDGCECVKGVGAKKKFLECQICFYSKRDLNRSGVSNRIRAHLRLLLIKKDRIIVNRIESLFVEGMSWKNRKDWHIDHIRPIKDFLDNGIDDFDVINHPSNLQPLWAKDNLVKGSKLINSNHQH